ncbi:MAG TPA: SDR family oxidoreductase [Caulobacteraceae bacterium]|jgi:3-oxoacyl-[acyl-carrier protein] reductase
MSDAPIAVVSGGSRGLGLDVVRAFLTSGYRVATFSRASSVELAQLEASHPDQLVWRSIDARDSAALAAFVTEVGRSWGGVDILVNNAGVAADGMLTLMASAEIDSTVATNLNSAVHLTQACAKWMIRAGRGAIVNVSSVNGVRGHSGVAVYSATKAAMDGVTRALARELGPRGIRVNSVAPGYFESDMVKSLDAAALQRIIRRTPLGRLARVSDITNVIQYLVSDAAAFLTGQIIVVDGGITC